MNKQDLFKLTGKLAIVTGGMRGLGYAIAVNLAKFGADIVIADIEMKAAEAVLFLLGLVINKKGIYQSK